MVDLDQVLKPKRGNPASLELLRPYVLYRQLDRTGRSSRGDRDDTSSLLTSSLHLHPELEMSFKSLMNGDELHLQLRSARSNATAVVLPWPKLPLSRDFVRNWTHLSRPFVPSSNERDKYIVSCAGKGRSSVYISRFRSPVDAFSSRAEDRLPPHCAIAMDLQILG